MEGEAVMTPEQEQWDRYNATRIVVQKNNGMKVFAAVAGVAFLFGLAGILFEVSQQSRPIGETAQVIQPYGNKDPLGMDIWLVYSQAGKVPVKVETPQLKLCHIVNAGVCQELACVGFETIVTVCRGGYIMKLGERK
jgi:hypothetical protein